MTGQRKSLTYHYLSSGDHLVFCAPWFRREGLCLFLYNDQEMAVAAAAEKARLYSYEIELEETDDVVGFLRRMADIGFAGAVLNDLVPVIFCREADGTPVFLRSLQNAEGGFSHFERLLDDGTWDVSGAVEHVVPLRDQQRFDRLIAGLVGEVPFRDYSDDWTPMTYSGVDADDLPVIDAAEGESEARAGALSGRTYIPLFSRFEFLEQFIMDRGIDPATVQRREVADLGGLTRLAGQQQALVLLNPGQHRADTAALGRREGGVALTSFSGRWFSEDGLRFRPGDGMSARPGGEATTPPKSLAEEVEQRRASSPEPPGEDGSGEDGIPASLAGEEPSAVTLDTGAEAVELAVNAEQVSTGTVNHALTLLCASFSDPGTLRWAAGRFHFRFADFEEGGDPYVDEGVRRWIRSLDRLLPVLAYFLSSGEGGQQDVARALLGTEQAALDEYVEDRSLMIQAMGEKYGVEVREACLALAGALGRELPPGLFHEGVPDGEQG